jgi:hemerythrin
MHGRLRLVKPDGRQRWHIVICNLQAAVPDFAADGALRSREPFDPMLEWKADYETGVPEIDTQHKVLFDNINRLGKLLDKDEIERAEVDYVLDFMRQYVVQHFRDEETCMARFRCPNHAKNKVEHAHLINALNHFNTEYEALGPLKEMLHRLHATLVWWINSHILKVDVELKGCAGAGTGAATPPIT